MTNAITPENWPAVSALLDEALALPAAERDTWLQSLDGERAELKATLRELLSRASGVETEDFLATLPSFTRVAERGSLTELASGEAIGPYRLLSELGTGGMGAVWLAERSDGQLKRKVALKLPRLVWAKGLAERMARERDILASLEHPHIARLYDAGVDQHGRPYLALEYVEGQPIDVYAKERGLSVRQKLDLLLQVCAAVAFAHSRLVVHRDLKPSNIMVTADGQVRLLDFGIAKLMEGDSTKETQLTQMAGRALTLDYASPEQIKGEPIGTASDVYSLGVVAYELLTGAKPYKLKRGSAAELEEAIATADPQKASEAAAEPNANKALKGDLDAILAKALQKELGGRYTTVDSLAQDLWRHLRSEPVSAQPESLTYRAVKFVRRNRAQSVATVAVIAAMAIGGLLAAWQAAEAQRQRDAALLAAQRSEESARLAQQESVRAAEQEQLASEAAASERRAAEGQRVAAQEALRLAEAERRASLAAAEQARRAESAAAQASAQARRAIAVQDFLFGLFRPASDAEGEAARVQKMTARELLATGAERVAQLESSAPEAHAFLLDTLGNIHDNLEVPQEALRLRQQALSASEKIHGPQSTEAALARVGVARSLRVLGRDKEAVPLYAASLPVLRTAERPREYAVSLAEASWTVAIGDPRQGGALARDALAALDQIKDDDATTLRARNIVGETLVRAGATDEGIALIRDTQRRWARLLGPDSMSVLQSAMLLANQLRFNYEFKSANATMQEILPEFRKRADRQPFSLARALNVHALVMAGTGQGELAEASMRESVRLVQSATPAMLDTYRLTLALVLLARDDPAGALREIDSGLRGMDPKTRGWANAQGMRSRALFMLGDRSAAEKAAADAVRLLDALNDQSIGASYNVRLAAAQSAAAAGDRSAALQQVQHMKAADTGSKLSRRTSLQVEVFVLHELKDDEAVRRLTEPLLSELLATDPGTLHARTDGELALRAAQARRASAPELSQRLAQRSVQLLGGYVVSGSPLLAQARELANSASAPRQ